MTLSPSQIKYLKNLGHKKYRQKYREFIIEGVKLVTEALLDGQDILLIAATRAWLEENKQDIPATVHTYTADQKTLDGISSWSSPQPVIALLPFHPYNALHPATLQPWTIALDGIQDPGNLGTIIRTADWFGIKNIFCSADCVEMYNPKVVQASMGSLFRVRIIYGDLSAALKQSPLKKIAATAHGKNMLINNLEGQGWIIIGNESNGIRPEILQICDAEITIPGSGSAESLNAAIAAAIIMSRLHGN